MSAFSRYSKRRLISRRAIRELDRDQEPGRACDGAGGERVVVRVMVTDRRRGRGPPARASSASAHPPRHPPRPVQHSTHEVFQRL
jgi:hypothetical protein